MVMAAPKPVPTHLKLVKGNPGKRAINKSEPKPPKGIPRCPAHLDAKAKIAWKNLAKYLDDMGVLTIADGYALERGCAIYARVRDLSAAIKIKKYSYETVNAQGELAHKAHPEVAMLDRAETLFKSYLVEFGLTPSARSKVSITEKNDPSDPLAKYGL
ncbi:MAG: P27 family predicted phage terminase small subunit [Oleiphilaceae bacterium]|jgi:P27 family predicted phage terminase small subunit